jgi:hypothetical protein
LQRIMVKKKKLFVVFMEKWQCVSGRPIIKIVKDSCPLPLQELYIHYLSWHLTNVFVPCVFA